VRRFFRDIYIFCRYRLLRHENQLDDESDSKERLLTYRVIPRFYPPGSSAPTIAFCYASIRENWLDFPMCFWISELQVFKQGCGIGSYLLLRSILKDADRRQLPVVLFPEPGGAAGIRFDAEKLCEWYARYGFVQHGGAMVYRAK
jgi:hypothetical protein